MPFTIGSPSLPDYVKRLPRTMQQKWIMIFNQVQLDEGEDVAWIAAINWLQRELDKEKEFTDPEKEKLIKRSRIKFDVDKSSGFIKRGQDGEEYVTLVLNTTDSHYDGRKFSPEMLQKWADQINASPIVGDVDHTFYDKVLDSSISAEGVADLLKNKKGIAKTVKAIYEKGKLWVRAMIDKRYKKVIERSKGVSAEALVTNWSDDNVGLDGDIFGFTFNVDSDPADYGAGVVA